MAVLAILLKANARQRWRSWLTLSLLVALVSGIVLATAAAGRRTDAAFASYLAEYGHDAFLYSVQPVPRIAALPEVASATLVQIPASGSPTCSCSRPINFNDFGVFVVSPQDLPQMVKLEAGRMPNQSDPHEVLASFTLEQDDGVHIGTVIRVPFAGPSQRNTVLSNGSFTPNGPNVAFRVVGIAAAETEFRATGAPSYDLFTTAAFAKDNDARTVVLLAYFIRLRHGSADLAQFQSQAKELGGLSVSDLDNSAKAVEASIHPQAVGWWALAALASLVGLIVLAQALMRQATVEAEAYDALSTLGVSRRQLQMLTMARTLIVAAVGVIGGIMLAYLLSPLTLVGEVRLADPSTGFAFDPVVLPFGALAVLTGVMGLAIWPAIRTARTNETSFPISVARPSRIVALLSSGGAPPSTLIGVRNALERGRGRNAIPVGPALLGSILAVTALCGTTVFGASLNHLTHTPTLYGQPFDLSFAVNQTGSTTENSEMVSGIERSRGLSAITAGITADVVIDGRVVGAIAGASLRGPLLASPLDGRLPAANNEVALGATTMRELGAHIGSVVQVTSGDAKSATHSTPFRIVGTIVFSPNFQSGGLGSGALFSLGAFAAGRCAVGASEHACFTKLVIGAGGSFLVRGVAGSEGRSALAGLARAYPSSVDYPVPPTNLVNFGEAINFPLLFGVILILFGTATLLHFLVVSVVRRRRELGLLKAIGFVRRQVFSAMSWQTTTVAAVGVLVGIPVGIAVGRAVWGVFADNLGVLSVPVVDGWVIVVVAIGTVLVANVLAIGPAWAAARSHPASLLKAE